MTKIALHLKDKPMAVVIQRGKNVLSGLTGNPYVPMPLPTLPELQAAIAAAEAASDAYEMGKVTVRALMLKRDDSCMALADILRAEAVTVEVATGGDAAKIVSTGFEIMSDGSAVGVPAAPLNFVVKAAEQEGALKARWKPVRGVRSYDIQVSTESPTSASWVYRGSATKAKALLDGFMSGTRIWVRVRGVGAAGVGAWSNAVAKIVP